jgi:phosphate starvation-inducible PhoH-like protein
MKRKKVQFQQTNVIDFDTKKPKRVPIYPKNLSQEDYLLKLNNPDKFIVFAVGPAGTGKTMLGVQWAIDEFKYGEVEKIIITRPAVSVDEQHGFLPGDLNQKMEPWTRPIFDIFHENYSHRAVEKFIEDGIIEISPLAYMRGRTFKNSIIIADECQGCTPNQMKMLLTRLGTGSKMVITGDLNQADRGNSNGLYDFIQKINNRKLSHIDIVKFSQNDVERHPVVKEVLAIYGDE